VTIAPGLNSTSATTVDGLQLVWKVIRDVTDRRGDRHVFYRQFVESSTGAELEVIGCEIGLHYRDATLHFAGGRQFSQVHLTNRIQIPADQAHQRTLETLAKTLWSPVPYEQLTDAERAYRDAAAKLIVFPVNTNDFRFAYRTYAQSVTGDGFDVVMDAQTAEILDTEAAVLGNNCSPTSPTQAVAATGTPVRPDVPPRSIIANPAIRNTFNYEAHDKAVRPITVFQQSYDSTFECFPTAGTSYTVFPVRSSGSAVIYDDANPTWHGTSAGDAMFRTRQTMNTFSLLGVNGWDGAGGVSQIVVDSTATPSGCQDTCGAFIPNGQGGVVVPPGGAVALRRENTNSSLYNIAASLDQIAHEWGHGLIFQSANFPLSGAGLELHEGFADVVGQMVEKLTEPSGSGVEHSADWDLGEDMPKQFGQYAFSATREDGTSGHFFGPTLLDNKFHKNDEPAETSSPHDRGNMLNVIFKELAVGGTNPICARDNTLSGCNPLIGVGGQGTLKASQILFNALVFYMPSNAQWADLATYVSQAAFDMYADCSIFPTYPATGEQRDVNAAFTTIGYPRTTSAVACQ
jgi:Zn-dependent metalloprotease